MTPTECATAAKLILAAGGNPIVIDGQTEIGTQEAADLLGVSRPTLIGILDRREIPFHRIGVHRRLKVADVLRYREEKRRTT